MPSASGCWNYTNFETFQNFVGDSQVTPNTNNEVTDNVIDEHGEGVNTKEPFDRGTLPQYLTNNMLPVPKGKA